MERMTFTDIVSFNYKDIKTLFYSRMTKRHLKFDEDAFNDAFIKCAMHFENEYISYDEAIKYFWTAYIHTVLNYKLHDSHSTEYLPELYDQIDNEYNQNIDELYDIIITDIKNEFGDDGVLTVINYLNHKTYKSSSDIRRICKYIKIKYKNTVKDILSI